MAYRTYIHVLNDDTLLQMFSHYRLKHEDNWNFRLAWRKLVHVCRRWRYLVFNLVSHLDICLLLANDSPSLETLSHLPPLPMVIRFLDNTETMERKFVDNIHSGLRRNDHLCQIVLRAPSLQLRIWLEPMDGLYPRLGDLSLFSTTIEETNLTLPETLQAPYLRRLSLHGIGLSTGSLLVSSAITLSTLSLTNIGASCYFPPRHLVTQLQGLPHLEELSIGFAIPIPLPSSERELLPPPISPVTLPTLKQLTFRGVDVYLDNLVAQINTPDLERLSATLFFDLTFTLVNLTEFMSGYLVARVIFNKNGPFIDMGYYEQQGVGEHSLHVYCEPLDWQIDSITQVCGALSKVVSIIEELTLDLDVDGMPSNWEGTLDNTLWHELLLPFIGVKKLRIGASLAPELSRALGSVAEGLVLEFLPELQELEVQLEIDQAKYAFSGFIRTRKSIGRPVQLAPLIQHAEPPESSKPSWVRTPTLSNSRPRSLISTVKQLLADNLKYVARVWRIDCIYLSCL